MNKPVKCVVLTVEFEIVVTNEFCNPIAKSKENARRFGFCETKKCPNIAIKNKIRLSIIFFTYDIHNLNYLIHYNVDMEIYFKLILLNFLIHVIFKKNPQ